MPKEILNKVKWKNPKLYRWYIFTKLEKIENIGRIIPKIFAVDEFN